MKLVEGQQKKVLEDKLRDLKLAFGDGGVTGAYSVDIIPADQYDKAFISVLITAMRHGLDRKGAAGAIGISYATFEDWVKKYPEFAAAAEVGDSLSQLFWQQQGIKNLTYSPTGRQINSKLYALFMQARFGWGEPKEESKKQLRALAFELVEQPKV